MIFWCLDFNFLPRSQIPVKFGNISSCMFQPEPWIKSIVHYFPYFDFLSLCFIEHDETGKQGTILYRWFRDYVIVHVQKARRKAMRGYFTTFDQHLGICPQKLIWYEIQVTLPPSKTFHVIPLVKTPETADTKA